MNDALIIYVVNVFALIVTAYQWRNVRQHGDPDGSDTKLLRSMVLGSVAATAASAAMFFGLVS